MFSRTTAAAAAIFLCLPQTVYSAQKTAWDYEGHLGHDSWGFLSPAFRACSKGTQQSPVDLRNPIETELSDVKLFWNSDDWRVHNNGHTIEVSGTDPGFVLIGDERWELKGLHFHAPSEHTLRGVRYPMEAHFIHQHEDGRMMVIGVLMKGGGRNDTFEAIIADAPIYTGDTPGRLGRMSMAEMVTDLGDMMMYRGSLTKPPCTESVTWRVLTDPLVVSDAAILAFTSLYKMNARPIQPLNRRFVLTD